MKFNEQEVQDLIKIISTMTFEEVRDASNFYFEALRHERELLCQVMDALCKRSNQLLHESGIRMAPMPMEAICG